MTDEKDDEEVEKLLNVDKPTRSDSEIESAEVQIAQNIKDIRYIVREYPAEVVVLKYLRGRKNDVNEIYVPDYQRDLVWDERLQSRFIESMLIGLPIPYIFVADISDQDDPDNSGRLEIVDGVQRIRTLSNFLTGTLVLTKLERLTKLNGFRFSDLRPSRQRRFRRVTLRLIELTEGVGEDVRREMFDRINTGSVTLEAVELRRGSVPGPFVDLTSELASDPLLGILAPISDSKRKRFEYEELVTRFFAFMDKYRDFGTGDEGKVVKDFLRSYVEYANKKLEEDLTGQVRAKMIDEWHRMLRFVQENIPNGFKRTGRGRQVPRVRFEAIAVGVGLALRDGCPVNTANIQNWITSDEFKGWTTSDAANNRVNVRGRIEFVRDNLLKQ